MRHRHIPIAFSSQVERVNQVMAGPAVLSGCLKLGLGLLLVVELLVTDDPILGVLLLPAAVLLLGVGLRDVLLRPTLHATASSITVVSGLRRVTVPWAEVEQLRVVTDRRAPLLEVDLGTTVVVLSRARLGVPPYQVLELLEGLRSS